MVKLIKWILNEYSIENLRKVNVNEVEQFIKEILSQLGTNIDCNINLLQYSGFESFNIELINEYGASVSDTLYRHNTQTEITQKLSNLINKIL